MKLLSKYFFNKNEMEENDYKYARIGFIADSAFYNGAISLLMGAYLTGLLSTIGATEVQTNLIFSLGTLTAFLQLLVPFIAKKTNYKKPFIFLGRFLEIPLLSICFLIPLILSSTKLSILLTGVLILLKHIFGWIYNPFYSDMLMDCLSKHGGIGKFSGIQATINGIVSCISIFFAGRIINEYSGNSAKYGYMWLGIAALILWSAQMIFLFFIKEPYNPQSKHETNVNFKNIFKNIFTSPMIRAFLLHDTFYSIGTNVSNTLTNIMCVQRLGMSLEIISYLTIVEFILRIILMPIFGKMTDKFNSKNMLAVGVLFVTNVYILHGLMNTSNMIIFKIISSISMCIGISMISVSSLAYTYESLPSKERSSYLACTSTFRNFMCTIVSLSVTFFMSIADGMNIQILNFNLNELNIMLFLGALITLISSILLIKKPLI